MAVKVGIIFFPPFFWKRLFGAAARKRVWREEQGKRGWEYFLLNT